MSDEVPPTFQAMLKGIIVKLFPWFEVAAPRTYTVERVNADGTVDLAPPRGSTLERIPMVPQWSVAGTAATPLVGSEVLIFFRDHDRAKPAIVSFTPLETQKPFRLDIDAENTIVIGENAIAIKLGGLGSSLAKAAPLTTWAGLVVTTVNALVAYVNSVAPGTIPTPLASLANPATTKVTGV